MSELGVFNTYSKKDQHVDTSIAGNEFTSSARVVIYAKPASLGDSIFTAIGVIQGWSFTEQRQAEELFELGSDIKYIVPGRANGQLAITRMLISGKDLVNTLYGYATDGEETTFKSLKDINTPIDLLFVAYNNAGTENADEIGMMRYFSNCWVVARQESITANQVVIAENCTLSYEKVSAVQFKSGSSSALTFI